MIPHLFPQKYANTTVSTICANWNSDIRTAQSYLLGAIHGARAAGNQELASLFIFYHNRLYNYQFASCVPLRNLTDNTPAAR
jgi:hypothetical protein